MTAFIVSPYADRVEILSDGAAYSEDGTLLGTICKVMTSDAVPLAIAGSGVIAETNALGTAILAAAEATGSVDETLDMLAQSLAVIAESPNRDTGFRISIGAISETDGPVCYVFSSFDENDWPAFTLRRMNRTFAQGCAPTGEDLVAYGKLSTADGLEKDAIFLLESMRKQKTTNPAKPGSEPRYYVGGHIDLTIVRADGYDQRRLHEWPDTVGAKIDPFRSPEQIEALQIVAAHARQQQEAEALIEQATSLLAAFLDERRAAAQTTESDINAVI